MSNKNGSVSPGTQIVKNSKPEVQDHHDNEGLISHVDYDMEASTQERYKRAIVLDAKLESALLESMACVAEIVDGKLFIELGFGSAKDYFETKALNVRQVYKYAQIGREVAPYLNSSPHTSKVAGIGISKLQLLAGKAQDQFDGLMTKGEIRLGDEVYSADELQEMTRRDFLKELSKMSEKVQKNELLEEQNKVLELERKALEKELEEVSEKWNKQRVVSETEAEILEDIKKAHELFGEVRRIIVRIDSSNPTLNVVKALDLIISTIQMGGDNLGDTHAEALLYHNDTI